MICTNSVDRKSCISRRSRRACLRSSSRLSLCVCCWMDGVCVCAVCVRGCGGELCASPCGFAISDDDDGITAAEEATTVSTLDARLAPASMAMVNPCAKTGSTVMQESPTNTRMGPSPRIVGSSPSSLLSSAPASPSPSRLSCRFLHRSNSKILATSTTGEAQYLCATAVSYMIFSAGVEATSVLTGSCQEPKASRRNRLRRSAVMASMPPS
mmetsp:Transcript_9604/g.20442  ORF Transcript_9604/g.20442 Transcript_9604/m.20442 type:complete len:212 (+) Transcript_9604:207-842(+)